jgi:hypothetical protein
MVEQEQMNFDLVSFEQRQREMDADVTEQRQQNQGLQGNLPPQELPVTLLVDEVWRK